MAGALGPWRQTVSLSLLAVWAGALRAGAHRDPSRRQGGRQGEQQEASQRRARPCVCPMEHGHLEDSLLTGPDLTSRVQAKPSSAGDPLWAPPGSLFTAVPTPVACLPRAGMLAGRCSMGALWETPTRGEVAPVCPTRHLRKPTQEVTARPRGW